MRTSFISAINVIGGCSFLQYFYNKIPTSVVFNNWLGIKLIIFLFALLGALVLHQKILLCIGGAGSYLFFTDLTSSIIKNISKKDISLLVNLLIGFIVLILLSMLIEFATCSHLTITNLLIDGVLSIVAITLINWLMPIIAKMTNLQLLNTWSTPCILIIFFVLIICINFKANYKNENLITESHLQNMDKNEDGDEEI